MIHSALSKASFEFTLLRALCSIARLCRTQLLKMQFREKVLNNRLFHSNSDGLANNIALLAWANADAATTKARVGKLASLNAAVSNSDDPSFVFEQYKEQQKADTKAKKPDLLLYDLAQFWLNIEDAYGFLLIVDQRSKTTEELNIDLQRLQPYAFTVLDKIRDTFDPDFVIASDASFENTIVSLKTLLDKLRNVKQKSLGEKTYWKALRQMIEAIPDDASRDLWRAHLCQQLDQIFGSSSNQWLAYKTPEVFSQLEYARKMAEFDVNHTNAIDTDAPSQSDSQSPAARPVRPNAATASRSPTLLSSSTRVSSSTALSRAQSPHVSSQNASRLVVPDLSRILQDPNSARLARIANQEAAVRAQNQLMQDVLSERRAQIESPPSAAPQADPYANQELPSELDTLTQSSSAIAELSLNEVPQAPPIATTREVSGPSMRERVVGMLPGMFRRSTAVASQPAPAPRAHARIQAQQQSDEEKEKYQAVDTTSLPAPRRESVPGSPSLEPEQLDHARMQHALAYAIAVW